MFPEITREDVFRLETRRLWLRWPTAADATAASADLTKGKLPEAAAGDPYRLKDAASVEHMCRENAAGTGLHLVLTGRGADRRPFGAIMLSPVRERIENCGLLLQVTLAESHRGAGFMTEAAQAVVDAAFMLTDTPLVAASSRVLDPAFRRVLEKCGFAYCGTGLDTGSTGGGLVASDRFRLDRKAWASLKSWRVPGVVQARGKPASAGQPC
jgi:RimJ/RimL family protein N-acetyltransferase